jgi:hypothetical protein
VNASFLLFAVSQALGYRTVSQYARYAYINNVAKNASDAAAEAFRIIKIANK